MRHALAPLALLFGLGPALVAVPAAAAPPPVQVGAPAAAALPTELTDYVAKPDASFSWKLISKKPKLLGVVYTIELVSQTWHDVKWDHKLLVFVPRGAKPQATMVLYNQEDVPKEDWERIETTGLALAGMVKAPVAFLFGVPKQPLYGGLTGDKLIAESFVRYLTTEDGSWPLLFPMVKSVVRGMDALQAFAKQEWQTEVKDFVITGASKWGWTTWLTAATGDKRVKAIAPLVFNTLNLPVQMTNQVKTFGQFSEMIADYKERLLIPIPKTKAAQQLWTMIDPWTYRERYTMPKMMVFGTNDPYWLLDGLNTYWDGLPGDKWVLYVPNAGHYMVPWKKHPNRDEVDVPEQDGGLPMFAAGTLCAFARSQIFNTPMPKLNCEMACPPGSLCLEVGLLCDIAPKAARLCSAKAGSLDFRKSWWSETALDLDGTKTTCKVELPQKGYAASFVQLEFEENGQKYHLSTPLRILEPKK